MAHPPSKAFQVITFWDGILLNTLQASSMLPQFVCMSTKLLPHKDIWITSTLNALLMNTSALFTCNNAGTCIQHPHKRESSHTPVFCICQNKCLLPLSTFHTSPISWHSKWPHLKMASSWTPSKHPPCSHILHTCPPSYSPQRYQACNHFEWSAHDHTCPLQVQLCWHMHSAAPKR